MSVGTTLWRLAIVPTMMFRWAALLVLSLAAAPAARAQDFVGVRALSLGEAYRSIATGNDAIYFNPAGLPELKRYAVELHYQLSLVSEQHQLDASLVDSKTSPIAVGLAYTFEGAEFSKRATLQHRATLALGYRIFDQLLSVGAGFKYINVSDAIAGNYLNALSADVGVLSRLPGGLSVAAVGYNLVPIQSAHVPISAGFSGTLDLGPLSGLIFGGGPRMGQVANAGGMSTDALGELNGPLQDLTVSFDWWVDFATLYGPQSRLSTGVEYLIAAMVPLRAGYLWDQLDNDHMVSVGAGFLSPLFGIDVGYRQSVVRLDRGTFAVALKFFLPIGS
jgi:hypothetical protein